MAYKYNVPVIPFVITYRERKGLYKLFGKSSEPLMTLTVGEPLLPDRTRPEGTSGCHAPQTPCTDGKNGRNSEQPLACHPQQ